MNSHACPKPRENRQTLRRKLPCPESNTQPSCCEAAVLTTVVSTWLSQSVCFSPLNRLAPPLLIPSAKVTPAVTPPSLQGGSEALLGLPAAPTKRSHGLHPVDNRLFTSQPPGAELLIYPVDVHEVTPPTIPQISTSTFVHMLPLHTFCFFRHFNSSFRIFFLLFFISPQQDLPSSESSSPAAAVTPPHQKKFFASRFSHRAGTLQTLIT